MERTTVPFRLSETLADLSTSVVTDGVIRLEAADFVIEFRETRTTIMTQESVVGEIREVRIPADDIEGIDVERRGLWGIRLRIRTHTLGALKDVPGARGNEVTLPVRRRHRERARELSVETSLRLAAREIRRLEGGE